MAEPRSTHAQRAALTRLAEQLRADCRSLARSVAALDALPEDDVPEALSAHLVQVQSLRESISARAPALAEALAQHSEAPIGAPAGRDAGAALAEVAARYRLLALRVQESLSEVERQLAELRQGGRALRTYARGGRRAG
jgi:hypothetical protein